MSHYQTLRVAPNALPGQVRRAFRERAKRTHPDHGGDGREFAAVRQAYQVLGDRTRRAGYDRQIGNFASPVALRAVRRDAQWFSFGIVASCGLLVLEGLLLFW